MARLKDVKPPVSTQSDRMGWLENEFLVATPNDRGGPLAGLSGHLVTMGVHVNSLRAM